VRHVGDRERVMLRRGNRGSAKYWRRVPLPALTRCRDRDIPKSFRGDAAFAGPKLLRRLGQEGFRYAIGIKAHAVLDRKTAPLLERPVGRPSRKPKVFHAGFRYQAKVPVYRELKLRLPLHLTGSRFHFFTAA
jgi:hypothetical protein